MSAQTTATPEDIIEESTKKDRILAAYRANPNADKNAVADALGVSYEYVRQIYKDVDDRNPTEMQKLQEGEPNKELDEELEAAVEQRLRETGALEPARREEQSGAVSHESVAGNRPKGWFLRPRSRTCATRSSCCWSRPSTPKMQRLSSWPEKVLTGWMSCSSKPE